MLNKCDNSVCLLAILFSNDVKTDLWEEKIECTNYHRKILGRCLWEKSLTWTN